jgi:carbamoyl-phosphate synthase large subunit
MIKRKIKVAVTGLNAIDSPGSGLSVIRALRESKEFDVQIIGLCYESLEPVIYMHDLVHKSYMIPPVSSGINVLMDRIRHIHEIEKLDVIIPNFDAELPNFISLGENLTQMGIKTFLPTQQQFEERQKSNLNEFGKKHGVPVPQSHMIFVDSDLASLDLTYPVMVKGKFYDAYVAHSKDQIQSNFNKVSARWGLPVIVQQFIEGIEVNVTAIGDGEGNMVGAVPMRKQYITEKGKAWAGISIDDQKLLEVTRNVIRGLKWRGGLEIEMIRTHAGDYYLLEINPRFPAWIYLAVGCGQNHPEMLLKMALGQQVEQTTAYEVGKMFVRYSYDMIVDLKEFESISTRREL